MTRQVAVRRIGRGAALGVASAVVAACSLAGGESATITTIDLTPTSQANDLAEPRDPGMWPFASSSPWNTPIGTGARFSRAGDEATLSLVDRRTDIWVNWDEFSHPVVYPTVVDPLITVAFERSSIPPFGAGVIQVQMPQDATPADGPDSHLHIIDPEVPTVHEFFGFIAGPGGPTAKYYVPNSLTGSGIDEGGTRAYGGSALGGLMRTWEVEAGQIRHALALALTGPQLRQGPVWPASQEDSIAPDTYRGPIPLGTLVAIPQTVDVEAMVLSPAGRMMAHTLQDYGAYVVDQARAMTFYAEPTVPQEIVEAIREDLPRIRRELRIVVNSSPTSVGGGGEPLAPVAPPLAQG